ncbi:MAG: M14 family zinc carboxypeptidase, partial [Rhodothermales bacterium]
MDIRFLRVLLLLLLVAPLAMHPAAQAQHVLLPEAFEFAPEIPRNDAVPSPSDFLGRDTGETYTLHADVVRYLYALADASDRVTVQEYGRTYEGRSLHLLTVTSPENHARLDGIKAANRELADPDTDEARAAEIVAEHPIVTWLSYNVHGNEPSSTESALEVLYLLAAGESEYITDLLEQSVVLIDPVLNPDGRDRYVYWYKSMRSNQLRVSADDLEHTEPWPGGRTNHYWFDLNRDWMWLVHPESQGRIRVYQEWMPQVHMDYHEQGFNNNYFTMPGKAPRNLNLPEAYEAWADMFGG